MNDSELLQLAKGWGNFVSDRINIWRLRKMQQAMLEIKKKFGKNAILKGMNLQEGATAKDRNQQIGGHKA